MRAKRLDEAKLIFQQFHPFVNASGRIEVLIRSRRFGHQRIRKPRGTRKRTRGYEETFWNEAATKAGERLLNQVLPANAIEVFAFVSGFSLSLDEDWRVV
jgi:hypothetical protein